MVQTKARCLRIFIIAVCACRVGSVTLPQAPHRVGAVGAVDASDSVSVRDSGRGGLGAVHLFPHRVGLRSSLAQEIRREDHDEHREVQGSGSPVGKVSPVGKEEADLTRTDDAVDSDVARSAASDSGLDAMRRLPSATATAVAVCLLGSVCNVLGCALIKRAGDEPGTRRIGDLVLSFQWFTGVALLLISSVPLHYISSVLAPLSITAPLSGATVVLNALVAPRLFGERLNWWPEGPATMLIIVGTAITTIMGAQQDANYTPAHLERLLVAPESLLCLGGMLLAMSMCGGLIDRRSDSPVADAASTVDAAGMDCAIERHVQQQQLAAGSPMMQEVLLAAVATSGAGAVASIAFKGASVLIRDGANLRRVLPWCVAAVATGAVQLDFLSLGLQLFPQTVFLPIQLSLLVIFTTLAAGVCFQEYRLVDGTNGLGWDGHDLSHRLAGLCMGMTLVSTGVAMFALRSQSTPKRKPPPGSSLLCPGQRLTFRSGNRP